MLRAAVVIYHQVLFIARPTWDKPHQTSFLSSREAATHFATVLRPCGFISLLVALLTWYKLELFPDKTSVWVVFIGTNTLRLRDTLITNHSIGRKWWCVFCAKVAHFLVQRIFSLFPPPSVTNMPSSLFTALLPSLLLLRGFLWQSGVRFVSSVH